MAQTIDYFPFLEKDILRLSLGLGEAYKIMPSCDEIAEILNKPKKLIDKKWATGIKSNVIFALNSYWCDNYDINNPNKCRSGGWVDGSER